MTTERLTTRKVGGTKWLSDKNARVPLRARPETVCGLLRYQKLDVPNTQNRAMARTARHLSAEADTNEAMVSAES